MSHIDPGDAACVALILLGLLYVLWHMARAGWLF